MHQLEYGDDIPVFDGVDWYWLPSMVRALRFMRAQRPAVVVFQWWSGAVLHSYLLLGLAARLLGASLVIEFHEIQDTGEARWFGVAAYVRAMSRRFIMRADAYVVHSTFDRDEVLAAFPADPERMYVLPHGPFDHYLTDGGRTDLPASPDDVTVLFFGTIRPYKGLEHLVEAFGRLTPAEAAHFRLLIVGETWEGWRLPLELAATSPHRERIDIVNRYVHDAEIAGFFARADQVALPYTRSSASGPLHIAMSFGLPVVLTDVGGLRDGAGDYGGITWVEPGNIDDLTQALRAMPAAEKHRYQDIRSWSESLQTYEKIFVDLQAWPVATAGGAS